MKVITRDELKRMLAEVKGTTFVTLTAETEPSMRKTDNPFVGATKVSVINGAIGFIYQNSVNLQRLREDSTPDFTAFPRKWGERVVGTPLVTYKDKSYLEVKVESKKTLGYRFRGEELPVESLMPFFSKRNSSSRQEVEKEVVLNDVNLENIRAVSMNKETYELIK